MCSVQIILTFLRYFFQSESISLELMSEESEGLKEVWVFSGPRNHFPSAIFTSRIIAEAWIEKHQLQGTLTAYPLNISVYDWATGCGYFKPKKEEHTKPSFIANFSSAYQEHYHYGNDEQ